MKPEKVSRAEIRERILEEALRAMAPYVGEWITTLGKVGGAPGNCDEEYGQISASTRVSAAKAGVKFVSEYLKDIDDAERGQMLLRELALLGAYAVKADGLARGAGADRALNAGDRGEEADLARRESTDGGD